MSDPKHKTEQEWQRDLSPEQFAVCRKKGTERPFTGQYYDFWDTGHYHCICCDNKLFSSERKYDAGSGWPSFSQPIHGAINTELDFSLDMQRTEVLCIKCDAHLGHVFEDGPQSTGLRYCINSIALKFK